MVQELVETRFERMSDALEWADIHDEISISSLFQNTEGKIVIKYWVDMCPEEGSDA